MEIAIGIFLVLHFVGLAAIIGSWLATMKSPAVTPGFLHGAILQLVSGLALVGLREFQDGGEVDHMRVGIKLVITVVVLVVAIIGLRKERQNPGTTATLAHVAGGLALLNVIIAVFV